MNTSKKWILLYTTLFLIVTFVSTIALYNKAKSNDFVEMPWGQKFGLKNPQFKIDAFKYLKINGNEQVNLNIQKADTFALYSSVPLNTENEILNISTKNIKDTLFINMFIKKLNNKNNDGIYDVVLVTPTLHYLYASGGNILFSEDKNNGAFDSLYINTTDSAMISFDAGEINNDGVVKRYNLLNIAIQNKSNVEIPQMVEINNLLINVTNGGILNINKDAKINHISGNIDYQSNVYGSYNLLNNALNKVP